MPQCVQQSLKVESHLTGRRKHTHCHSQTTHHVWGHTHPHSQPLPCNQIVKTIRMMLGNRCCLGCKPLGGLRPTNAQAIAPCCPAARPSRQFYPLSQALNDGVLLKLGRPQVAVSAAGAKPGPSSAKGGAGPQQAPVDGLGPLQAPDRFFKAGDVVPEPCLGPVAVTHAGGCEVSGVRPGNSARCSFCCACSTLPCFTWRASCAAAHNT